MRLSAQQRSILKHTLMKYFGSMSGVWLFGSRVNDQAQGGDIDIYIEPEINRVDEIVEAKLDALAELHQLLGEQKIDLVINRKRGTMLPIYTIARQTGVPL